MPLLFQIAFNGISCNIKANIYMYADGSTFLTYGAGLGLLLDSVMK